jgi:lysine-specific histone demethylase 1
MALTFDPQIHHQDDLGHDTLMGLQELDSHLAIFEETAAPASLSDSSSDDFHDATDLTSSNHSHESESNNFNSKVEPAAIYHKVVEANGTSKYAHPTIKYLSHRINISFLQIPTNLVLIVYSDPRSVVHLKIMEFFEPESNIYEHQQHRRQRRNGPTFLRHWRLYQAKQHRLPTLIIPEILGNHHPR